MTTDPATIDRYAIEELLGEGATGKVYLAFDTKLQRRVALKVLNAGDRMSDPGAAPGLVDAALREARAAGAIAHPNAATVYDADRAGDSAFIVMEHVPGKPLRLLIGDADVPLSTRVRWLVDIAGALAAAHAAGIVHRDVKPENVLVREDGVVKVLDFGIARFPARDEVQDLSSWSSNEGGELVGTPAYMAPEVLRGLHVDARADQFAWGVLAYELLSGHAPWRHTDTSFGTIACVLTETPAPLGGDVPPEIAAAVARALAKSPEDRFPNITAAAAALAPFAGRTSLLGVTSSAPPPRLSSRPPSNDGAVTGPRLRAPSAVPTEPPPSPPRRAVVSAPKPSNDGAASGPKPRAPAEPSLPPASSFRTPDFRAPVDVDANVALLPPGATAKGMFFLDRLNHTKGVRSPEELARAAGIPHRRYANFLDYPAADLLRLTAVVAQAMYPGVPLGEGLRRIGHRSLDILLSSRVGRAMFGVLGRDAESYLLRGPRAYRVLYGFGEVSSERLAPGELVIRYAKMPVFLETAQTGAIEAVLRHCERKADVKVASTRLDEATFLVRLR